MQKYCEKFLFFDTNYVFYIVFYYPKSLWVIKNDIFDIHILVGWLSIYKRNKTKTIYENKNLIHIW